MLKIGDIVRYNPAKESFLKPLKGQIIEIDEKTERAGIRSTNDNHINILKGFAGSSFQVFCCLSPKKSKKTNPKLTTKKLMDFIV